jgi:hypothetical protein
VDTGDLATVIPDLRDIPPDQLGGTVLERSIALYLERLRQAGEPLSSFNASIR